MRMIKRGKTEKRQRKDAPTSNNDSSKSSSEDTSTWELLCECLIPGIVSFVIPILRPSLVKIGSPTSGSPLKLELLKDMEDGGVLECAEPFCDEVGALAAMGLLKGAVANATGEERVSSIPCIMFQN